MSLWFDLGLGAIRINLAGVGCFPTHSLGFPKFPSHEDDHFIFERRYGFLLSSLCYSFQAVALSKENAFGG